MYIQSLEALLAAERAEVELLKSALNHVGRGIQMIDSRGYIVVANDLAAELSGVPAAFLATRPNFSEVVARQWQASEFEKTDASLRCRFLGGMANAMIERYRRLRPNGVMLEVESIPLAGGGLVRIHTDISERHTNEQRIAYLARHDYLTGLYNRATFQEALEQGLKSGAVVGLLLIDIDRFKEVNDGLGHAAGDALLIGLAARLREAIGPEDVAARFGGDEFALMLFDVRELAEIQALAVRLIDAMNCPFQVAGKHCLAGISIGVAASHPETRRVANDNPNIELLRQADLALYAAKSAGRGVWRSFDPALQAQHMAEQVMQQELQTAIAAGQFAVFYQPLINARSGRVSAFEALVRWHHPVKGLIDAAEFIPPAEASGLIVSLGKWVLRQACLDAANWPPDIRVLVNFSPRQLACNGSFETIQNALSSAGLAPSRLEIEITESSLLQMSTAIDALLKDVRALGTRIALDDFGTGYSSLSHLRQFSFDTVKIDRTFVAGAATQKGSWAIIRAVVGLAAELGLKTIAEGVETAEQAALLGSIGCDELQGYLFSTPRPSNEVTALLDRLNLQASQS